MLILLIMCTGQQVGGNSLMSTYSTCELGFVWWTALTLSLDFFQEAGLTDPFKATMIQT